ncbi:uncharacterized protein LOC131619727 [Vicia villosa]|uniref:uncharacterized protein LOC131619727 n=1 Tax=Vicia villosa TaxID=3911 RepID=UPI00273C4533|nr:uncharacterized protein LOC131619727 [Vicia villosa]
MPTIVLDIQAKAVWLSLLRENFYTNFFLAGLEEWMHMNLNANLSRRATEDWSPLWATTCHTLWFWRNKRIHDDTFIMQTNLIEDIRRRHKEYKLSLSTQRIHDTKMRNLIHVNWSPAQEGYVTLNIDGVSKATELWGILEGIKFARMKGYTRISIQSDNKYIVDAIAVKSFKNKDENGIYNQIRKYFAELENITLSHVFREANKSADIMANLSLSHDMEANFIRFAQLSW